MSKQQFGPTFSSFLLMLTVVAASCTVIVLAAVVTNPTNANEVGRSIPPCPPPLEAEQPKPHSFEITVVTDFGKPLDGVTVQVGYAPYFFGMGGPTTDAKGKVIYRYDPAEVAVVVSKDGYITTEETVKLTPPVTKATIKLHKRTPLPEQDKSA